MAQKLGVAPTTYNKEYFDDCAGKINRMFAQLQSAPNSILSGNGTPPKALGSTGSFYVDLQNKVFYGPKSSNGWAPGFSLIA